MSVFKELTTIWVDKGFGSAFFCSKKGGCPNTFVNIVYVQVIGVWGFKVTPEVLSWDFLFMLE